MRLLKLFKRKKERPKRALSYEEVKLLEEARKEAEKWQMILDNIIAYDGTAKGQKRIG